jgi:hypothetical protein
MVRITHGAYGRIARLECDQCGEKLYGGVAMLDCCGTASVGTRSSLREQGQRAGWTGQLRSPGGWRDLCPTCFKLPPPGVSTAEPPAG